MFTQMFGILLQGALAGLISSLAFSFWVVIGSIVSGPRPEILNINTGQCDVTPGVNTTYLPTISTTTLMMTNYTIILDSTTPSAVR